jgi:hypothetical protein
MLLVFILKIKHKFYCIYGKINMTFPKDGSQYNNIVKKKEKKKSE